jgi:hypothetical protein
MASSSLVRSLKFHYAINETSLSIQIQSRLSYFVTIMLIVCYILGGTALYGAETRILQKVYHRYLKLFEMWVLEKDGNQLERSHEKYNINTIMKEMDNLKAIQRGTP